MKNLIIFLISLLSFTDVISQAIPKVTKRTNGNVMVEDGRLLVSKELVIPVFNDTTLANVDTKVDSCGSIIYTRTGKTLWLRECYPKKWSKVNFDGYIDIEQNVDSAYAVFVKANGDRDTLTIVGISGGSTGGNDDSAYINLEQSVDSAYALFVRRNGDKDTLIVTGVPGGSSTNPYINFTQDTSYTFFEKLNGEIDTLFSIGQLSGMYFDSTSENFNSTKYIFYNLGIAIDSVSIYSNVNIGNTNLTLTSKRKLNGAQKSFEIHNTTLWRIAGNNGVIGTESDGLTITSPIGIILTPLNNDNALTRVLVADVNGRVSYRDAGTLGGGGGGPDSTTASNGLTLVGKDVRLGGTLTGHTDINPNGFVQSWTGNGSLETLLFNGLGPVGQFNISANGNGVLGNSDGAGNSFFFRLLSNTAQMLYEQTSNGNAGVTVQNDGTNPDVIIGAYTNAATASHIINVKRDEISLGGQGAATSSINFLGYGGGTITGTPSYGAAFTSSGKIIEVPLSGGSVNSKFNEEFTGSTSTTLTLSETYLTGTIRLYKNGARLLLADFTEASGTTITLNVARLTSDVFTVDFNY